MSDDSLRGRFHAAAAEPSAPLDWPHVLERGLRRRRRRRAVPAALTAAVVVAAAIAIPLAVVARGPAVQMLHGTPASPSWKGTASPASHVPAGWRAVTYGDVQIAVPASWQVIDAGITTCRATSGGPAVALGAPGARGAGCRANLQYLAWARSAPSDVAGAGTPTSVNGVSVAVVAGATSQLVAGPQVSYLVPTLGVELTVSARWARSVIGTVSPSPRAVVARPGLLPYTPTQWRPVELDGVTLRVPPTWPVVERAPAVCDALAPWTSPEVDIGPSQRVFCATSSVQHFVAGAWIFPSPAGPSASWGAIVGGFQVTGGKVQVFAGDAAATWIPVLVTPSGRGTPVGLWLGVGTDGVLARDVLGSVEVAGP